MSQSPFLQWIAMEPPGAFLSVRQLVAPSGVTALERSGRRDGSDPNRISRAVIKNRVLQVPKLGYDHRHHDVHICIYIY